MYSQTLHRFHQDAISVDECLRPSQDVGERVHVVLRRRHWHRLEEGHLQGQDGYGCYQGESQGLQTS